MRDEAEGISKRREEIFLQSISYHLSPISYSWTSPGKSGARQEPE